MKKIVLILSALLSILLMFSGCNVNDDDNNKNTDKETKKTVYNSISASEAKKIMDEESGYVILDVRTEAEYADGHIQNSILIPDYDIKSKVESILTDKDQLILVYCRSGRRSAAAAREMISLGYTNVIDFGGIIDWGYETVK